MLYFRLVAGVVAMLVIANVSEGAWSEEQKEPTAWRDDTNDSLKIQLIQLLKSLTLSVKKTVPVNHIEEIPQNEVWGDVKEFANWPTVPAVKPTLQNILQKLAHLQQMKKLSDVGAPEPEERQDGWAEDVNKSLSIKIIELIEVLKVSKESLRGNGWVKNKNVLKAKLEAVLAMIKTSTDKRRNLWEQDAKDSSNGPSVAALKLLLQKSLSKNNRRTNWARHQTPDVGKDYYVPGK